MPKFKIGDKVTVTTPLLFDRCGYNLTIANTVKMLRKDKTNEINAFLDNLGINHKLYNEYSLFDAPVMSYHHEVDKFLYGLAYIYVKANGFGGKERKIFEHEDRSLLDDKFIIIEKKRVVTGNYYPPSGSYDYYEHGGLNDQKHHLICHLKTNRWMLETTDNAIWVREEYINMC